MRQRDLDGKFPVSTFTDLVVLTPEWTMVRVGVDVCVCVSDVVPFFHLDQKSKQGP